MAEKKISTKINYDVLRSLSSSAPSTPSPAAPLEFNNSEQAENSGGIFGTAPLNPRDELILRQ